jgi:hypothetical protein
MELTLILGIRVPRESAVRCIIGASRGETASGKGQEPKGCPLAIPADRPVLKRDCPFSDTESLPLTRDASGALAAVVPAGDAHVARLTFIPNVVEDGVPLHGLSPT